MNAAQHTLQWVAPAPLWPKGSPAPTAMRQPALLRFTSDQFVNELNQALANGSLGRLVATWESQRLPPPGTAQPWAPAQGNLPLKLFQPIHGRFYMVAASFVCRQPGMPDHALKVASDERTYFVLRRIDSDGVTEMAWVPDPSAPTDPTKRAWLRLSNPNALAPNEDLIPLFPAFVPKTAASPGRRLHVGLVPTSSRETLAAAPTAPSPPPPADVDPRVFEAQSRVVDAYAAIVKATVQVASNYPPMPLRTGNVSSKDPSLPLIAQASVYLMVDLAEILEKYVPDVFAALTQQPGAVAPTSGPSGVLYAKLQAALADRKQGVTWATAIGEAWQARASMDTATPSLPSFSLFYVNADPVDPTDKNNPASPQYRNPDPSSPGTPLDPDSLDTLLKNAIVAQSRPFDPPDPVIATPMVPKLDGKTRYVVRCVFQRCALKREKFGAMFPPIVSDPTQRFEIAPFFDTDAPARTIRIPMPVDTSPAALRKFPRSVGFLLSPQLQQQMCQVSDLASVLKGQLGSCANLGVGEICCFSMPIITIIAMILMMMMAILLNFVFWWLPFLKICFPVPAALVGPANEPEEA